MVEMLATETSEVLIDRETPFKMVSQNVQKSAENATLLLERFKDADAILMQESPWIKIKTVASTTNPEGEDYFNTIAHRSFVCFGAKENSRVTTYINKKWVSSSPRQVTTINHNDVVCVTLTGKNGPIHILNVYNDPSTRAAVEYLQSRAAHFPHITVMAGDFNVRHPLWETRTQAGLPKPAARDVAEVAMDELNLSLLNKKDVHTWQSNNAKLQPRVLDLVWMDNEIISKTSEIAVDMDGRNRSDHAILSWEFEASIETNTAPKITRESEAEERYVLEVQTQLEALFATNAMFGKVEDVKEWEQSVRNILQAAWESNASVPKPSKHSKSWWSAKCTIKAKALREARAKKASDSSERKRKKVEVEEAQRDLKSTTRHAKRKFFDRIIEETKPQRVWDLVDWTKPRKQSASMSITKTNGEEAESAEEVCEAFKEQFIPAIPNPIDSDILEEYPQIPVREFSSISPVEIGDCLSETSNKSAPGPDSCTWRLWKKISTQRILEGLARVFDACIECAYFPAFFKKSVTVVIPKPKKKDYSKANAYRPIVLLNCLGKLFEKVLAKRIQFESQKFNVTHPCQYGGTKQHSTTDAGVQLVHGIKQAWKQGLDSSVLLLDISQFFPSLNHEIMVGTMRKQGFANKLCNFFGEYLKGRSTRFQFNGQRMEEAEITVGVGQGSALSPILSGLYIASIVHKWAPVQLKKFGNMTLQFFVDDGLIHVAAPLDKNLETLGDQLQLNNAIIANVFGDLTQDLLRAGLKVEQSKLELMHFRRAKAPWTEEHPLGPPLAMKIGGGHVDARKCVLEPQKEMRYLGFFLDPKLSWKEHIRFYTTKASSTVNAIRMLGNANRGLSPKLKRTLYISNVLPILLYGAQLWWRPSWKSIKWIKKTMARTQARAARWITGSFKTSPTGAMEMIAGLIPIRHQINTQMRKTNMRTHKLHKAHPIRATLGWRWDGHELLETSFPLRADVRVAETPATHIEACIDYTTESFDALHDECTPGQRIVDNFYGRISWELEAPKKGSAQGKKWLTEVFYPRLEHIRRDPEAVIVFTDGSLKIEKKWIAGAAWHVYKDGSKVASGKVGCGKASAYDAEMMALARGLQEAAKWCTGERKHIHAFADNRGALQTILKPKVGPAQYLAIEAAGTVREFLRNERQRSVTLHWCPGHVGVKENEAIDKEAKKALDEPQPEGESWSVAIGRITREELDQWKTLRRNPKYRGKNNLTPLNDKSLITATNRNWFITHCGNSARKMARMARVVTGHMPCGAYRGRFNIEGDQDCACGARAETRHHILRECQLWIRDDPSPYGSYQSIMSKQAHLDESLEGINWFLQMNPLAASFEWTELREEKAAAASAEGEREVWCKMSMLTMQRKTEWERWRSAHPRKEINEFKTDEENAQR